MTPCGRIWPIVTHMAAFDLIWPLVTSGQNRFSNERDSFQSIWHLSGGFQTEPFEKPNGISYYTR